MTDERVLHRLPWALPDVPLDSPAVRFLDGPTFTRAELLTRVEERADQLRAAGVGGGDRVCLMEENGPDFVLDLLAVSSIGAVSVPLNLALRGQGLIDTIALMAPCRVRVDRSLAEVVEDVRDALDGVDFWFTDEPMPGGIPSPAVEVAREDLAMILLTSGTTGLSKGVMWSHQMAITFAENTTWVMGYTSRDVLFTCLPLFHINALLCSLYAGLMVGAEVVIAPRFSASAFWSQLTECGATTVNMMGAIPAVLWSRESSPVERAHSLRLAMVLPLPADRAEFEHRFGVPSTETYGSTDTGLPLGIPFGQRRPGSCGLPTPGWQVELVDERDRPVPRGTVGELVTRPSVPFMGQLGYWRQPEVTLEAMRNQWFHTGDLCVQDDEGWFTYLGRRKEMVRVSGENVAPGAVEAALLRHPAVLEAAVFGVPSELGEEDIAALVVLRPGAAAEPSELRDRAASDLPYFAVPRYIGFADTLPKTATQKVQKAALQAAGVSTGFWDGGRPRRQRA